MRPLTLLALLWLASTARAGVYYLTIASYQVRGPTQAHSFAVVERISDTGLRERRCISWMPDGPIRLLAGPVAGRNWSERETLEQAARIGARVTYHGPYPVDAAFYLRFIARLAELESGVIKYRALDGQGRDPGVSNCIGAISTATLGFRLPTGLRYGERASRRIALEYERERR
jgi:hypothetical protein